MSTFQMLFAVSPGDLQRCAGGYDLVNPCSGFRDWSLVATSAAKLRCSRWGIRRKKRMSVGALGFGFLGFKDAFKALGLAFQGGP